MYAAQANSGEDAGEVITSCSLWNGRRENLLGSTVRHRSKIVVHYISRGGHRYANGQDVECLFLIVRARAVIMERGNSGRNKLLLLFGSCHARHDFRSPALACTGLTTLQVSYKKAHLVRSKIMRYDRRSR